MINKVSWIFLKSTHHIEISKTALRSGSKGKRDSRFMLLICAPFCGTLLWWSLHLMKLGHHFFLSSLKKNDVASNFKTASESGFKFKVDSPPWFWIMQGLCYSKAKLCMLRHLQFSWVFCKAKSKFWEQPLRAPLKANGIGVCAQKSSKVMICVHQHWWCCLWERGVCNLLQVLTVVGMRNMKFYY